MFRHVSCETALPLEQCKCGSSQENYREHDTKPSFKRRGSMARGRNFRPGNLRVRRAAGVEFREFRASRDLAGRSIALLSARGHHEFALGHRRTTNRLAISAKGT
jgi:hypothetical protein